MQKKIKKLPNRRESTKYPALREDLNLKTRRYYIEPHYMNGVRDASGKMVIRPLTEDEKEWLNKFYEESICASFKKDGTDIYDSAEDRKMLYKENNHRNLDLFFKVRVGMDLTSAYKQFFDRVDFELVMIEDLEKKEKS